MSSIEMIQRLRDQTGLPVMDLKKALEEARGDETKALDLLKARGVQLAQKRADRTTSQGIVASYVHTGRIGAMVALQCETDFVAKTDDFQNLAKDLAMQIASMAPASQKDLLEQPFIKDATKTVSDLITEIIAKTGENIRVGNFSRIELGIE